MTSPMSDDYARGRRDGLRLALPDRPLPPVTELKHLRGLRLQYVLDNAAPAARFLSHVQ